MSSVRRLRGIFDASIAAVTKPDVKIKAGPELRKLDNTANKTFNAFSKPQLYRTSFEVTLRSLVSAGKFSAAEELLEEQKKFKDFYSERYHVRLILLYGKAGMYDHARKWFDEMPERNGVHNLKTFNTLLSACTESKKFDKLFEIIEELPEKLDIELDIVSYNIVIRGLCGMGSLDSALSMVDELERKGLKPNIVTFNMLLEAFHKHERHLDAEKIWCSMESKNLVPDIFSYNSKLRGMVAGKKLPEAVEVFDEMKKKGIKPSIHTFNALIKGFSDDRNLAEAKRWFLDITKNGCTPDRVTYGTFVPFLCENGDLDMARKMCLAALNKGRFVHLPILQAVVDALVKESRTEEAVELAELVTTKEKYYKRKLYYK